MVVLLATGAVPPAVAGLLAAGAIVLTGVLDVEQAYRGISVDDGHPRRRDDPALDRDDRRPAPPTSSPTALVDVVGDAGPHALARSASSCSRSRSAS